MEDVTIGEVFESQKQSEEKDNNEMVAKLLENAKAAIMGAVELHNKPIFPYRYEISIILTINAWELAMKAYILTYHKEVKVFIGDSSKEFLKCLGFISYKLGKDFLISKSSVELIYKYRCDIIHFYGDGIESILYSLLRPNILYFGDFLKKYFEIDLANEANLIILPLGFKRTISPIDFLSENSNEGSKPVKEFINSIVKSAKVLIDNGFEDGLICNYDLHIDNVNKIKNADIVVGVTKEHATANLAITKIAKVGAFTYDPNAPQVRIDEESLFKSTFTITHNDFLKRLKENIPGFKVTNVNRELITNEIKKDANCYRIRFLDGNPTPKSSKKGFYSEQAVVKAINIFKPE